DRARAPTRGSRAHPPATEDEPRPPETETRMSTLAEAIAAAEAEGNAALDPANRIALVFVTPLASDYDEVSVQTYALPKALLGDGRFGEWIGNLAAVEPARGIFARFLPP